MRRGVRALDRAGYARLHRLWNAGDEVELNLDMPVRQVSANPAVEADRDLIALMRGPILYCLESAENPGGIDRLIVPPDAAFTSKFQSDLLGGVTILQGEAQTYGVNDGKTSAETMRITAVPFYASANREPGSLRVWLPINTENAL